MSLLKSASIQIVVTIILFVIANIVVYPFLPKPIPNSVASIIVGRFGMDNFRIVYPGKSEQDIIDILSETWGRVPGYEPFTQYEEREVGGKYVNIHKFGFRRSPDQADWPPSPEKINIFFFGGSTTFGYGVEDGETIPSRLQAEFRKQFGDRAAIYNFGQEAYYSTMELILFEKLLLAGHRPDVAIFTDGLNDLILAEPLFAKEMRCFMNPFTEGCSAAKGRNIAEVFQSGTRRGVGDLPIVRAMTLAWDAFRRRDGSDKQAGNRDDPAGRAFDPRAPEAQDDPKFRDPAVLNARIDRYLASKKMIEAVASHYGVKPIFVWQPAPTYKYNEANHLFAYRGYKEQKEISYTRYGYPLMRERVESEKLGDNFLWCADIQEGVNAPLYVDTIHYTAAFSLAIADCVAAKIRERNLLGSFEAAPRK